MPFDLTIGAIIGDDALTPLIFTRDAFKAWLEAQLNDPAQPYAALLGLTQERRAYVFEAGEQAQAVYRQENSPPVVVIHQGAVDQRQWWKEIDGLRYSGSRLEIEWSLDSGIRDRTEDEDDVAAERLDDSSLSGFVSDILESKAGELDALGLFNTIIAPDPEGRQRGMKYPQKVTFFTKALRGYTP